MPVTSQHGDTPTHNESGDQQGPTHALLSQHSSPDWDKMTPLHWQQHTHQLSQSDIKATDRLYWMLTFRDWLKVNLHSRIDGQNRPVVQYTKTEWDNASIETNLILMCEVAYKLCDWALIIKMHQLLGQIPHRMDVETINERDIVEWLQLAVAHWQMGQLDEADQLLQVSGSRLGSENPLADFHHQIKQDMAQMPFELSDLCEGDLLLMPLEEQHLGGFSWVYHDPQIAKLCNLPEFGDDEQWFDWLDADQSNPAKQVFAVIHAEWGLIGSVSIEVHDGAGFFYYWLGQDFQGGGLGGQSVLLLLRLAGDKMGMTGCYAKAFAHNVASQKAMNKIGFNALPFKVAPPNEEQLYFYRGPDKPERELGEELVRMAAVTDVGNEILLDV